MTFPKVFVSYSRESDDHVNWVRQFAERLRRDGVDVVLDQWDLGLGQDVTEFMERNLTICDRVLIICTEEYVQKANTLKGGVGYERMIITADVARNLNTDKFIPVLRSGTNEPVPRFMGTRIYSDFRVGEFDENSYEELLRELHKAKKYTKPPMGTNPYDNQTIAKDVAVADKSIPVPNTATRLKIPKQSRQNFIGMERFKNIAEISST